MKSSTLNFYQFFLLLLIPFCGLAQPSFHVDISFRFYNKSEEISKNNMLQEYTLLDNYNLTDINPIEEYSYDDSSKMHKVSGTIIYNDFCLLIAHKKDTMRIVFKTLGGERLKFKIDQLNFKDGTFIVDSDVLKELDLKNIKSNHYNYLLSRLPKNIKNLDDNFFYIQLKKLKLKYGIEEDDFRPKKESDLIDIFSLSDALILKKYKKYLSASNSGEHDIIYDGKVYSSSDQKLKIFVFKGESCGANCTTFYNSFIHFNLGNKTPNSLPTDFFPIDAIIKLNNDYYLVLQSGIDGGGIDINEHKIATLIQYKNDKIDIGKTYTLPDMPDSKEWKSIDIIRNTSSEDQNNGNFYLKFDPKTNILEYKYWSYIDEDQTKKKIFSGKFVFNGDYFRKL